jgi:hypothetical protein
MLSILLPIIIMWLQYFVHIIAYGFAEYRVGKGTSDTVQFTHVVLSDRYSAFAAKSCGDRPADLTGPASHRNNKTNNLSSVHWGQMDSDDIKSTKKLWNVFEFRSPSRNTSYNLIFKRNRKVKFNLIRYALQLIRHICQQVEFVSQFLPKWRHFPLEGHPISAHRTAYSWLLTTC